MESTSFSFNVYLYLCLCLCLCLCLSFSLESAAVSVDNSLLWFTPSRKNLLSNISFCGAWWRIGRVEAFRIRLYPPRRNIGQVLHLQLPVAPRRVNSDTVSIAVVWSASAVRSTLEMDENNTLQYKQ